MRTQIPKFRLPDSVVDEETDYILNLGIEFKGGTRIDSMKALLAENFDAIFVGSGAPRGRELDIPGRKEAGQEHPHRHRLAVHRLVRPHRQDRQARHRARRRQHRDGLLPHRAPARRRGRQGDRALRLRGDEGVALGKGGRRPRGHPDPQFPGAEVIHPRQRQADRRGVREGQGRVRRQGPAQARADRRAGPDHPLRRRAGRGRPGERVPLDRARHRHRVRQMGYAGGRHQDHGLDQPEGVLRRRRGLRPEEHHLGGRARPRRRAVDPQDAAPARTSPSARCPSARSQSQKMGIHEWSYDNDISIDKRYQGAASRQGHRAEGHQGRGRARLRRQACARRGAALPELRRADRVRLAALHRVRCLRRHLPDGLHHLHGERRRSRPARRVCRRPRPTSPRTFTSPTASKPAA